MKTIIISFFFLALSNSIFGQECSGVQLTDTTMVEKYDFERTENGTKSISYLENDWLIVIWKMPIGYKFEYAPADLFYKIEKRYYPNGNLSYKGMRLGSVKMGRWYYYNEDGTLKETVDEDAKFGAVKPSDILKFMEEEGLINRKKGTSVLTGKDNVPNTPFTDGRFYSYTTRYLEIRFWDIPPENALEGNPRKVWSISYMTDGAHTLYYGIDGETKEVTKNLVYTPYID